MNGISHRIKLSTQIVDIFTHEANLFTPHQLGGNVYSCASANIGRISCVEDGKRNHGVLLRIVPHFSPFLLGCNRIFLYLHFSSYLGGIVRTKICFCLEQRMNNHLLPDADIILHKYNDICENIFFFQEIIIQ